MNKQIVIGDATLYCGGLFLSVKSSVFYPRNQFKVFNSIICLIAVAMMYKLARFKRTAKMVLHYYTMLPAPASLHCLRANNDVSAILCFSGLKKVMRFTLYSYSFFLQASATMCNSLAKRPFRYWFLNSAIASAHPIVKTANLFIIPNSDKPSESLTSQIRDFIFSPILCIGGNHVGTI